MTANQDRPAQGSGQKNEGEGNRTAAAEYNKGATRTAQSGKVDQAAQEARRAVDGPEGKELRDAEAKGRAHAKGEDPQLKK
jgi:hypothetical protein